MLTLYIYHPRLTSYYMCLLAYQCTKYSVLACYFLGEFSIQIPRKKLQCAEETTKSLIEKLDQTEAVVSYNLIEQCLSHLHFC